MSIKLETGRFYRDHVTGEKLMYMGLSWLQGGVYHLFIPYRGMQAIPYEAKTFPHDIDQGARFSLLEELQGFVKENDGYIWAAEDGAQIYVIDCLLEMSCVPKFYKNLADAQADSFEHYELYRIKNHCELEKINR